MMQAVSYLLHCLSSTNNEHCDSEPAQFFNFCRRAGSAHLIRAPTVFQDWYPIICHPADHTSFSGTQLVFAVHQTLPFFVEVGGACETMTGGAFLCAGVSGSGGTTAAPWHHEE